MKPKRTMIILLIIIFIGMPTASIWAGPSIHIHVKTILAAEGSDFIDPRLSSLIRELQSVFKYSSYRLIGQNRMRLAIGQTGIAKLPGNRVLKITPLKISGNRVRHRLIISRQNRQIFQTVIQLINKGSITVGGPSYQGGYLLLNISSTF